MMNNHDRVDYQDTAGQWGRDGDQYMAHVAPGEMVVPPVISPELRQRLFKEMQAAGIDPAQYTVGGNMSINPMTGMPEFGFFKKVVKKVKKVVKKVVKSPIGQIAIPVATSLVLPGIGTAAGVGISAAEAAALGSVAATKLGGGSWGQSIGAGVGSLVGSQFVPGAGEFGPSGTVGAKLASNGLTSVANALPGAVVNANLASVGGAFLGSNLGAAVGGMIDPPKATEITTKWGSDSANYLPSLGVDIAPSDPATADPNIALPSSDASGNDASWNKGSGVSSVPSATGVNYLTTVRDRNTGQESTISTPFSNSFGTRRQGWGGGVTFV